ncbi:Mon2 C-terminal [Trinorchestia longiramus]|nr:Mon2 C-terminal [Trinorchestia longiramus]
MWHSIGVEVTRPPSGALPPVGELFVPTQPFLTALLQTLPHLFQHIIHRLGSEELRELSEVLQSSVQVPVAADSAAFVLPSASDSSMVTPLQDAVLAVLHTLLLHVTAGGFNSSSDQTNNNSSSTSGKKATDTTTTSPAVGSPTAVDPALASLVPQLFSVLLHFASYSYKLPAWGGLHTRPYTNKGGIGSPAEYVTPPYATFSERCVGLAVRLYQVTATWPPVLAGRVLENIVQCCSPGLGLKYLCPSWRCLISALLTVLETGLPLARSHPQQHVSFWATLNSALDGFLFSSSPPPPNQSGEEAEADEELDCRVVQLLQEQVLPHPSTTPPHFLMSAMVLLNKGSIHSAPTSGTVVPTQVRLRRPRYGCATPGTVAPLQVRLLHPRYGCSTLGTVTPPQIRPFALPFRYGQSTPEVEGEAHRTGVGALPGIHPALARGQETNDTPKVSGAPLLPHKHVPAPKHANIVHRGRPKTDGSAISDS